MSKKKEELKNEQDYKLYKSYKRLDKRMEKYINKKIREQDIRYRLIKYITGIICSIYIGIFVIYVYDSSALAVNIPNFIIESYKGFIKLQTKNPVFGMVNGNELEPVYIPEGYEEVERVKNYFTFRMKFAKGKKEIIYQQVSYGFVRVDDDFKEYYDNGNTILVKSEGERTFLVWYIDDFKYILIGDESIDVMMKIKKQIS